MSSIEEFREAVRRLHRAKDAAYRDAWKKRGEVMGIMANIARKVDRLEYVTGGAPATQDESLVDTATDLLVYAVKYQTYLADTDSLVATATFGDEKMSSPCSDGPAGFEMLWARQNLDPLDHMSGPTVAETSRAVVDAFAKLEAYFVGEPAPVDWRRHQATELVTAAVGLLAALKREAPTNYHAFLAAHLLETD